MADNTSSKKEGLLEKFVPILLLLTVALAFVVGILWNKVSTMEKGGVTVKTGDTAAQPDLNGKLSEAQVKNITPVTNNDHIRGSIDAQVLIVEYSDLECPFCKDFHATMQTVLDNYKGKVAWVYRHFPLTFHANAQKEAEGAECVSELGGNDAFWKYADAIFERTTSNGTGFALTKLGPLAKELGLDQDKFQKCLDSGKYADLVQKQMTEGGNAGVTGTPGSFVMNKKGDAWFVPGALPFESMKATIDEALK